MATSSVKRILTFADIRAAICDSLQVEPDEVEPKSSFVSLGASSLDRVQLILDLEEALGVEIPDDDAAKFCTVQDVMNYLK